VAGPTGPTGPTGATGTTQTQLFDSPANPQTIPAGNTMTLLGGDCTALGSYFAVSGGVTLLSGEVQTETSTPGNAWAVTLHNPGAVPASVNVTSLCQPV
jgi:hypothetical protein